MAQKIDLMSIYTSEEKYTVLQLLKKLIEEVDKVKITQIYKHHFAFSSTGMTLDIYNTDPTPIVIDADYEPDPMTITYNGIPAKEFFGTTISVRASFSGEYYDVLGLGDQDTEVGAIIDTGTGGGAMMYALTDGEEPSSIVDTVTQL